MAIKGVNPEIAKPYIPECERSNLENPTIFWIRPRNSKKLNESAKRYWNARVEKRGQVTIDEKRATNADIQEFAETVEKVENYIYSSQFSHYREEDGSEKLWKEITDRQMIEAIALDLPIEIFNEIIEASISITKLEEGDKKK